MKVIVWNIGFINDNISNLLSNNNFKITWLRHNFHDRFFADPFILDMNENTITVLAEEFHYTDEKGRIVKLTVDKSTKKLLHRQLLIETDYHLSYPFIYKNTIIPEQSECGKWIKYDMYGNELSTISDIGFIDGTIFNDGTNEWLFATRVKDNSEEANHRLYRYKMIEGKPIPESELLIKDSWIASRPGGNFFKIGNQWYRVAQTSTKDIYGESVSIFKIISCTDDEYQEEVIKTFTSHHCDRFNRGLHTINSYDNMIIVDGFEYQIRPLLKIKCKLYKKLLLKQKRK